MRLCSCEAPHRALYRDLPDRLFDVPGVWSIHECETCKLSMLSPRPTLEEQAGLYASYYTHDEAGDDSLLRRILLRGIPRAVLGYGGGNPFERFLGRQAARLGPLLELGEHATLWLDASQSGELLDYGCGSGVFLERMMALGWRVAGFELDAKALAGARGRLGDRPLYSGACSDIRSPAGGFDVVTLAHVVEHLDDPETTLRTLRALLRPGGRVVILTPNNQAQGRRCFGPDWLHWDPPRHLQVFSERSLSALVVRAGLAVERVATPSSTAHFAYRASAQIARTGALPGGRLGSAGWRNPSALLGSLGFWWREHRAVEAGERCGEELLVVARRPEQGD